MPHIDSNSVLVEKNERVALMTLNRPDKLNALNNSMKHELCSALQAIREDDDVRALVITGAGRGFCSGADIGSDSMVRASDKENRQRRLSLVGEFVLEFEKFDKPIVGAINGVAAGIGLTLALICDLRVASPSASFGAVWVKRGLIPDGGATVLLPAIIGLEKTLELTITGDIIKASSAHKIGLVSQVVPTDESLQPRALELASHIASQPPIAVELTKRLVLERIRSNWREQLMLETYAQNQCRITNDHKESISAFREKRLPRFTGT